MSLVSNVSFTEVSGLKIRNKLLGKCLQAQGGTLVGRVSVGECDPYSPLQEWRWIPEGRALSNHHTGECLSAPGGREDGVYLRPCVFQERESDGAAAPPDSQAWSCSRKGHLTLAEKGLHLSATQQSTLVILSQEHNQVQLLQRSHVTKHLVGLKAHDSAQYPRQRVILWHTTESNIELIGVL